MSLKDAVAKRTGRSSPQKEAALADVSKGAMKRLNVNVPESLLQQFKAKAALEGRDMSELVNEWIEEYLSK